MHEQLPHAHPAREEQPNRPGDETAEGGRLAQFELLADPATISGDGSSQASADSAREIERLRSALHSRARELEAMRSALDGASSPVSEVLGATPLEADESDTSDSIPTPATSSPISPRLDFDAALALAREARQRVDSTRRAVESVQLEVASQPSPEAAPERGLPGGWSRHAMVTTTAAAPSFELQRTPTSEPIPVAPEVLALREEVAELRATVEIARETTIGQRNELTQLRLERTRLESEVDRARKQERREQDDLALLLKDREQTRTELLRARDEAERLRDRLTVTERDYAALESDSERLRQTLGERECELADQLARSTDLEARLAAATAATEMLELKLNRERERSESGEQLLANLRSLLDSSSIGETGAKLVDSEDAPMTTASALVEDVVRELSSEGRSDAEPQSARASAPAVEPEAASTLDPSSALAVEPAPTSTSNATAQSPPTTDTTHPSAARPLIFDAWLDDQLRRHFGPMGIDRLADLVQAPLAQRGRADQTDPRIAILGAGSLGTALRLAESLQATSGAFFELHVFDPEAPADLEAAGLSSEHPLREFVSLEPVPDSPGSLSHALDMLEPSLVITRQFVSDQSEPEAWLGAFERVLEDDGTLIFLERTDHAAAPCPPEMAQIGERIWELMPERYKRDADSGRLADSWQAAFEASRPPHTSTCQGPLRDRFDFELSAQFGYLATPFVASTVGANFSPDAPRDRRFLQQVADLDDRKIEAGVAPALYWIAVASPSDEDS